MRLVQVPQALQATIALADSGTVVVFTHGLPINVVLSHALGLEKIVHFQPGYGSVSHLSVKGAPRRTGIYSINEHGHPQLPAADLRPTYHE
jgi:probable phosphoglycerate mutase